MSNKKYEGADVKVGQLRLWKSDTIDQLFLVVRVGPDSSDPVCPLGYDEVEIHFLNHKKNVRWSTPETSQDSDSVISHSTGLRVRKTIPVQVGQLRFEKATARKYLILKQARGSTDLDYVVWDVLIFSDYPDGSQRVRISCWFAHGIVLDEVLAEAVAK